MSQSSTVKDYEFLTCCPYCNVYYHPLMGHHCRSMSGFTQEYPEYIMGIDFASPQTKDSKTIRVKYFDKDLIPLEYIGHGISDWVDLRCAEDISLKAGEAKLISLGIAIELPVGYEAIMAPRSSTFKQWGIMEANSIGVIDEAYCGDNDMWRFAAYATRDTQVMKNDRICQFRIIEHQPALVFETVEHLGNADRNGFGSTGHK